MARIIARGGIDPEWSGKIARRFGVATFVLFVIFVFSDEVILKALLFFALAYTVFQTVFHGGTAIAAALPEQESYAFQAVLAVCFPLGLSIYFVHEVESFTVADLTSRLGSPWVLLALGLVSYFGWALADQLDRRYPVRGFIIASSILFVVHFFGYHGIHSEQDYYGDGDSVVVVDHDRAKSAAKTGSTFGIFLAYVIGCQGAMFLRLRRLQRDEIG